MEMVVGHFGHLGFVSSSEASFSFPRLMVTLASAAVKRAQADATTRSLAPMNMGDYMDPMFFNEAESVVLVWLGRRLIWSFMIWNVDIIASL